MSLASLKDRFEGERVFLVGNGPSLAETPLDLLAEEYTFGLNEVNHIYEKTEWRPTFYYFTIENLTPKRKQFIEQNIDLGITCFIEESHRPVFGEKENVYYITTQELKFDPVKQEGGLHEIDLKEVDNVELSRLKEFWSDDIEEIVYRYHSMYGMFQIATYLGFEEMYLIGCDLGFTVHNPHMFFEDALDPLDYIKDREDLGSGIKDYFKDGYDNNVLLPSIANGILFGMLHSPLYRIQRPLSRRLTTMADPNHFTPGYREKPKDNRYANMEIMKSHKVAKRITSDKGIKVFNATIGGELEVYPRVDLKDKIQIK